MNINLLKYAKNNILQTSQLLASPSAELRTFTGADYWVPSIKLASETLDLTPEKTGSFFQKLSKLARRLQDYRQIMTGSAKRFGALHASGDLTGIVGLGRFAASVQPEGYLYGLVVTPPFRSNGLAAKLLAACEAEARRLGYVKLHLSAKTPDIQNYYTRKGYRYWAPDEKLHYLPRLPTPRLQQRNWMVKTLLPDRDTTRQ